MYATKLDKPGKVHLADFDPDAHGGLSKDEGKERLKRLGEELASLQELLYAAGQNALLIVLQGRDTSGKDGTINHVIGFMNTVGCEVASFKVPSADELAHDFLWRVHVRTPALGQVTVFNRSHYEDVLVVRVRKLAPEAVWKRRYAHIAAFEELLHDAGVIVVKFYLHISRDEQEERLRDREKEPTKAWKLNPGDWEERHFWDAYTAAYEDALGRCAAPHAPWFLIPADHKWFRNLAVAEALVETLRPYQEKWTARLAQIGETQRTALEAMRAEGAAPPPK